MFTFPSVVTAAKTVEEYGAQATSVTPALRSKVNTGELHRRDMNFYWNSRILQISYYSFKTNL